MSRERLDDLNEIFKSAIAAAAVVAALVATASFTAFLSPPGGWASRSIRSGSQSTSAPTLAPFTSSPGELLGPLEAVDQDDRYFKAFVYFCALGFFSWMASLALLLCLHIRQIIIQKSKESHLKIILDYYQLNKRTPAWVSVRVLQELLKDKGKAFLALDENLDLTRKAVELCISGAILSFSDEERNQLIDFCFNIFSYYGPFSSDTIFRDRNCGDALFRLVEKYLNKATLPEDVFFTKKCLSDFIVDENGKIRRNEDDNAHADAIRELFNTNVLTNDELLGKFFDDQIVKEITQATVHYQNAKTTNCFVHVALGLLFFSILSLCGAGMVVPHLLSAVHHNELGMACLSIGGIWVLVGLALCGAVIIY